MSHEITKIDRQQGLQQAWHNLTEVLPVIILATCFLASWDVLKRKLFRPMKAKDANGADVTVFQETDTCELVCTDDDSIIIGKPVHCETYTVLTNKSFLEIVQKTMDKIRGSFVASLGSVCARARIFVSLAIPRDLGTIDDAISARVNAKAKTLSIGAAGREFEFYLNFLSSHDKSAPFTVVLSSICTVCNNTFNMNLTDKDGAKLRISIPHTKNMATALENVPEIIDAFFVSAQKFIEVMTALEQIPISASDAKAFFTGFLFEKDKSQSDNGQSEAEENEISTRRANQIDRLTSLFVSGKGNAGQNLCDVFSAVTDYYSHENSGGDDKEKQIASSEFGNGAAMKAYAFAILQDDKKTAKLIAKGQKVLAGAKE